MEVKTHLEFSSSEVAGGSWTGHVTRYILQTNFFTTFSVDV